MDKTQMILDEARHNELLKSSEELLKALKNLEKVVTLIPTVDVREITYLMEKLIEKTQEIPTTTLVPSPSPIPEEFFKALNKNKNYQVEITGRDFEGNIKNLNITQI